MSLTLSLLCGAVQDSPAWKPFTAADGSFSISLPGLPTETKQRVKTATGHLDVTLFVADGPGGVSYVVSYSDLPSDEVTPGSAEKRLNHAREGAVTSARGKLRSEKRVEVEGQPAREVVIDAPNESVIRLRMVAAGRRLYQVMAIGPEPFANAREVGIFLDSFRLGK